MNTPNPKNRKHNKTIEDLISFIENASKSFTNSKTFRTRYDKNSDEDDLTEILIWHYEEKKQKNENYFFMAQPKQEAKRKVDIGIGLHGGHGNYIFCIEAKKLPTPEYVTGNGGAIKRFKKCEHGLSTKNGNPLLQNGIIAYVKSGTFKEHLANINEKIKELVNDYSQKSDEFGLIWNNSEKLEKIYFKSTGKLLSEHSRIDTSIVTLHHFWIYVNPPK